MNAGRLVLRVTVGSIFMEHGTQKLFGWFGGHGLDGNRPLLVSSLALAESGPGRWSLDALMKSERRGPGWAAAALVAAVAGTTLVTKLGNLQPAASGEEGQAPDERVAAIVSPGD